MAAEAAIERQHSRRLSGATAANVVVEEPAGSWPQQLQCDIETVALYKNVEQIYAALNDRLLVVSLCMPTVSGAGVGGGIHVDLNLSDSERYLL
jgi:hypothetical protein